MASLLLITHGQVGEVMLEQAVALLGKCPLPAKCLAVVPGDDPNVLQAQALQIIRTLNDDVIILTDLFGSTPSNIAARLMKEHDGLAMIAGINVPMLMRLFNYAGDELEVLVEKAVVGARDGIFLVVPEADA